MLVVKVTVRLIDACVRPVVTLREMWSAASAAWDAADTRAADYSARMDRPDD